MARKDDYCRGRRCLSARELSKSTIKLMAKVGDKARSTEERGRDWFCIYPQPPVHYQMTSMSSIVSVGRGSVAHVRMLLRWTRGVVEMCMVQRIGKGVPPHAWKPCKSAANIGKKLLLLTRDLTRWRLFLGSIAGCLLMCEENLTGCMRVAVITTLTLYTLLQSWTDLDEQTSHHSTSVTNLSKCRDQFSLCRISKVHFPVSPNGQRSITGVSRREF